VTGLKGQYFDEFNLGYERLLGDNFKVGVQGVYRTLREAVEVEYVPSLNIPVLGNPGSGLLSDLPKAQRDYTAIVFTVQGHSGQRLNFLASYVLSRNYGNYPGLYNSYNHYPNPNANPTFDYNRDSRLSVGLLPNDRTHVIKLSGSYQIGSGFTAGTSFSWQSGTPLSEFAWWGQLLTQRGTSGKTPSSWDLNARVMYDLPESMAWRTRLILDIFHIASQQVPVDIDQEHYLLTDGNGNPYYLNPTYGMAFRYQPAMSARFGLEASF
jgi:hypothetical protein